MNNDKIPPLTEEDWKRLEKISGYAETMHRVIKYLLDMAGSKES